VVLIGDDKQLGPVFDYEVKGSRSMFERLIDAGAQKQVLNIQYRMHPYILSVSNELFYENRVADGYDKKHVNIFLNEDRPLLIVNVKGKEKMFGTSVHNEEEAIIVS